MAVVTTEEAIAFVEHAMRNWDDLRFDTDDLEDLRLALGQFLASHTKPAQVGDADREAAWKKLREYCTNGLPFYDNEDGWRAIANAVLRAAKPAQVDVKQERAAFEVWWKSWCPDRETPAVTSHIFDAWLASARHRAAEPAQGNPKYLIRCMGGKFCHHQPGTCTATRATEPAQVGDADFTEAWTGPTPEKGYVGFINITRIGGNVRVRLRPESHPDCGQVSELDIPVANARDLFSAIGRQLGIAQGRAEAQAPLLARIAELEQLVVQYRSDLKYPPTDDSRERRLEAIERALKEPQQ